MAEPIRRVLAGFVTLALAAIIVVGLVVGEPTERDRVAALGSRIRCPVCQGEAISESPSETARSMMEIVEEQVAAGVPDDEIIEYFRARFGDFIVLDPPFRGLTLVLWLLPLAAVAAGVLLIIGRRRQDAVTEPEEVAS